MELFIFGRFHAKAGNEAAVEAAIREVIALTSAEDGCLHIHAFQSVRDARLFYVHAHWRDDAAFEAHADMPHTLRFLDRVEPLIDHKFDITRHRKIA